MIQARAGVPATEKQEAFAASLLREVNGDERGEELLAEHRAAGTFDDRRETSNLIDALMGIRKAQRADAGRRADAGVVWPEVGYYCVEYDGDLRFYAIRAGRGKWEGRTFCNRFRSDELGRVGRAEQMAVLASINADPEAAAKRFADETVRCFSCGRRLTDQESRRRGQGAECAGLR